MTKIAVFCGLTVNQAKQAIWRLKARIFIMLEKNSRVLRFFFTAVLIAKPD